MIQLKKPTVLLLLVTQCFRANRQIVKTKFPMINKVKEELLRFFINTVVFQS